MPPPNASLLMTILPPSLTKIKKVDRYPVSFRSSLDGRVYRHIILAVLSGGLWGALGLSRRDSLMYKELRRVHTTLDDVFVGVRKLL